MRPSVVVVGGGVCGLSAARALARSPDVGHVQLLEADELCGEGGHCASVLCSGIIENMGFPSNCGGEATLNSILTLGTQRIYEELHRRRAAAGGVGFARRPYLVAAVTEAERAHAEKRVGVLRAQGYRHVKYIDGNEARSMEPLLGRDVLAAVCLPEASTADPSLVVAALAADARDAGVAVHDHAPVTAISQTIDGAWEVETAAADLPSVLHADAVILATGAATARVAALVSPEVASLLPVLPVQCSMYGSIAAASDGAERGLRSLVAELKSDPTR